MMNIRFKPGVAHNTYKRLNRLLSFSMKRHGMEKKKGPSSNASRSICGYQFFVVLFIVAFGLNWVWEMFQMAAYNEMAGRSWRETALRCTVASVGDAILTLGAGLFLVWRFKHRETRTKWEVYINSAFIGAACAVAIEWIAIFGGRWSYSDRMPQILWLRVGMWPLLQLTLLTPAALWIATRWSERASRLPRNGT